MAKWYDAEEVSVEQNRTYAKRSQCEVDRVAMLKLGEEPSPAHHPDRGKTDALNPDDYADHQVDQRSGHVRLASRSALGGRLEYGRTLCLGQRLADPGNHAFLDRREGHELARVVGGFLTEERKRAERGEENERDSGGDARGRGGHY